MAEIGEASKVDVSQMRSRTEAFVEATQEIGLVPLLARLGSDAYVLAPDSLLQRVRTARGDALGAPLSANYDSVPPFSPNIYVFDLFPGVPSEALVRMRPDSNIVVINRDLVVQLVLKRSSRESHHHRHSAKIHSATGTTTYCILTSPRAGASVLAQLMRGAGIGDPCAHFREPLGASLREGFPFADLLERIQARSGKAAIFGTRINSQFVDSALCNRLIEFGAWAMSRGVKCIRLRRDVMEQAVSLHFAIGTGVWEAWEPLSKDHGADVACERQPIERQMQHIVRLESLIDKMLVLCPAVEVMTVDYPELLRPEKLLKRVCEFLDVSLPMHEANFSVRLPLRIGETNPYMSGALTNMLLFGVDDMTAV